MDTIERIINAAAKQHLAWFVLAAIAVSACAPTTPATRSANIEIQQDVGFTITEEARIGAEVRSDYDQAMLLLGQGRQADAIAILEQVAAAAPTLSAPRIDLGIAYHRTGDLENARLNLEAALAANPDHPIAYNELGTVYRKLGRFDDARRSYEAALAVYPGFHYARRNLAILCDLYLGDLECALENYEAYMATVRSDDEASMWVADIRSRLGR